MTLASHVTSLVVARGKGYGDMSLIRASAPKHTLPRKWADFSVPPATLKQASCQASVKALIIIQLALRQFNGTVWLQDESRET